ncbi:MAG TPA: class I SAM-dependent rRNA methyltransferase [Vicinamibacterales bacterium]
MPSAVLTPKGVERAKSGHLWIYRSDIAEVSAQGGDIVDVVGPRGRPVGAAFYSDRSQIALRLLATGGRPAPDDLLRTRLEAAIAFREGLNIDATAYRLVHAEGDLLPSLIVDRYAEYLVVQTLSQATERRLPEIIGALQDLIGPKGILLRNDAKVRALEGLEPRVDVIAGEIPEAVTVREGRVLYDVDLRGGQKTGLFLDQRENREAALRYAHGRLLDAFSYNGGFALALAPRCSSVVALEISTDASARIRANAERNGIANVEVRTVNVFDELHELDRADERFDTIVLDPPAFAKNKASVPKAVTGYREINRRALRLLPPGGILVTCSCSHHVDEVLFEDILRVAAADAGASVSILEKRTQGRDHPVLLGVPETLYLKCFILRKIA